MSVGGVRKLVLEAKRQSVELVDTKTGNLGWYVAGGKAIEKAKSGLEQAKRYCSDSGVLFSALSNGVQWIGFWAIRTDGTSPFEGKAAVFPNLESIKNNFAVFYDLFSRSGIEEQLYQVHVREAEGLVISHSALLESVIPMVDIKMKGKSEIASDLETIYARFFSRISGNDKQMLAECFVESKESNEADDQLQRITSNLVSRVDKINSAKGQELADHIQFAVETGKGEFVLIIGNKGAGKSTFIDRFFSLVLDRSLRDRCLVLRVDLADSNGDIESIQKWLNGKLKDAIEEALFDDGSPTYEELQGAYWKEYERWRTGERKPLYERSRDEFKERFGEWLATEIGSDPQKYIQRLLHRAIRSRKLMPCVIFDNTDHFVQKFQEAVFQYAQSLHRSVFSFVICPITDRTLWRLSKEGPFQSYESASFYLPVPSTKSVLAKRVQFIKERLSAGESESKQYFTEKGIRLSIKHIDAFAATIERVFINEDYVGRLVGWLSNHDIRRSLQIAQRIVTSPVMSLSSLVDAYVNGEDSRIRISHVIRALLLGDYTHFKQGDSHFVLNLFQIDASSPSSPLLQISILRLLADVAGRSEDVEKTYLKVGDIVNYFEPCTVRPSTVKDNLQSMLDYRLVEPYDPTELTVYDSQRLRITHCGRIHFELATHENEKSYLIEMALVTPISDLALVAAMRADLNKSGKLRWNDWVELGRRFGDYCLKEDRTYMQIPNNEAYRGQLAIRTSLQEAFESSQASLELD